ncbi:hypothetical protein FVR03_09320 [Pontibacter qinzhouensis]|uniref:Endonuclease/exonuclease/phosphatase domain-containing protein n=1 Tax=Pontibacter qinzhouensis TaxID=2603253 RepID=A0A5C8KBJ1_9BACT|nr:hypothetical protein [Pontibacter qinzhouensis]TXK47581.1 hypothetical protein FVR03_09320 [Pontibacter qinzhouensis]
MLTIAFYNLENLYDTENDPAIKDDAFAPGGTHNWTEERYKAKLNDLANTIASMGDKGGPAVLGVAEVENKQVLEDLIKTSALRDNKYEIIHYDSPDASGLDVALLYKPRHFQPTAHASLPIGFAEANYQTTGILQVKGLLRNEPVTLYINYWPNGTGSTRIRESRKRAAAITLRQEINEQQKIDKDAKIIVMGNFAVDPSADVLEQALLATGRPDPLYNQELFNAFYMHHINKKGSSFYRGSFQMQDQIMISKSWIGGTGLQFVRGSATIHQPENLKHTFGKYKNTPRKTYAGATYQGGTSSHFPIYLKVQP